MALTFLPKTDTTIPQYYSSPSITFMANNITKPLVIEINSSLYELKYLKSTKNSRMQK